MNHFPPNSPMMSSYTPPWDGLVGLFINQVNDVKKRLANVVQMAGGISHLAVARSIPGFLSPDKCDCSTTFNDWREDGNFQASPGPYLVTSVDALPQRFYAHRGRFRSISTCRYYIVVFFKTFHWGIDIIEICRIRASEHSVEGIAA